MEAVSLLEKEGGRLFFFAMTTRLTDITTNEVSLVGKGANRKKFLLFKSDKEDEMDELIKELLEETQAIDGEKDLLADLKKGKFSPAEASQVQAALRLLSANTDKVKKSGIVVKAFETVKEPEKVDAKAVAAFLKGAKVEDRAEISKELGLDATRFEEGLTQPIKKDALGNILKADGSLDLDNVPKELRPAMQLLFKSSTDNAAALKVANEKIEKADKEAKRSVWIKKADEFKDLPGTNVEELADTLMELSESSAEKIMQQLRASKEVIKEGGFFTEQGRPGDGSGTGSTIEKVNTLAKGLVQKNEKLSNADALQQVLRDNPALYAEYKKETQIRA